MPCGLWRPDGCRGDETGPVDAGGGLGRRGAAALGLSPSGALDRKSLALANALLGNAPGAAGLEMLLGGLRLRFVTASTVAVTGAKGRVAVNGAALPLNEAVRVAPGAVLDFGVPALGLRYYLAVQRGIDAPMLLGSRSADTLSGEGPAPLKEGDAISLGHGPDRDHIALAPVFRRAPDPERPVVLRVDRGPGPTGSMPAPGADCWISSGRCPRNPIESGRSSLNVWCNAVAA